MANPPLNERRLHEVHNEIHSNSSKISFSNHKLEVRSSCPDSTRSLQGHDHAVHIRMAKEMLVSRFHEFQEQGAKTMQWISENVINMTVQVPQREAARGSSTAPKISLRKRRQRRHLNFARMSDVLDGDTQEKLEDVKEDVIHIAQQSRVPVPAATLPVIGYVHSLTIKNLLCGVLAGAVASTAVVPFDIVRTRVIAGQGGRTAAEVLTTVAQEEGLQTLMKGSLKFNIILNALSKGFQFTTFEFVKRFQEQHAGGQKKILPLPRQIPLATAGGAAAGFFGTLLTYPLQPAFDRVLLQPDKYPSLVVAWKHLLREGGFLELYRGVTPALIAMVPNAAISFYTYDTLKTKFTNLKSTPQMEALQALIIGGLAGAISTTLTFPLEEARKQIVLSTLSPRAVHLAGGMDVVYNNTWQALNGIVKREGWNGLFRGLTARNLQLIPMTAITFMVYEIAKRAFVASGEERRDEVKDVDDIE